VSDQAAPESPGRGIPGWRIVVASWLTDAVFAITAVPAAAGVDAFETPSIITSLVLFLASIAVWVWALGIAAVRSARGDEIVVANLFLVEGEVPRRIRLHLFAALVVALVIAGGTAVVEPFGVLVPMLNLGFAGLWGARHGRFPARRGTAR
jgi:hypothetical protein